MLRAFVGGALVVVGAAIMMFQGSVYLREGYWPNVSLIEVGRFVTGSRWFYGPAYWHELHGFLGTIPASLVSLTLGLLVIWKRN